MLELKIETDGRPPLREVDDPGVTVWRQHDGSVAAWGYRAAGSRWMRFPGLATYGFRPGAAEVTAVPEADASRATVVEAFERSVLPMALQAEGREALHASGVATDRGVVALAALSETGKSTIAYALVERGHIPWADDAVLFEPSPDGAGMDAVRLPFRIRLRPASERFFANGGGLVEHGADEAARVPLAAVCLLERGEGDVRVEQVAPAEAFPAVLTHAYCFDDEDPERRRLMVERYLELVARVPVLRVRFAAGLHNLPAILDAIEGL
jgi:hypothetical protein